MYEARHISVSIKRPWREVYDFARRVENLPQWASGLDDSIGKLRIRFAPENVFGVLDHDVTIVDSGATFYNPMRVTANGDGSEVSFTLFKLEGMSASQFAADAETIAKDLAKLKQLLES
jgi:hypothetical protein